MFTISKNASLGALNLSVQVDIDGIFDLVPLYPFELAVNLNTLVVHAPGFAVLNIPNAQGLYIFFERNGQIQYENFLNNDKSMEILEYKE